MHDTSPSQPFNSSAVEPSAEEIDLDPANWDAFARLAHGAVDDMVDFLRSVRERPVWSPPSPEARRDLEDPLPLDPQPLDGVYSQFRRSILPFPTGNIHPRFWGWVMGTGTAEAMLADLLASAMNNHLAGYDQSGVLVEQRVLKWLNELMGFPATASGLLVSGGTTANLHGLAVARHAKAGFDLRQDGLVGAGQPRLRAYGSSETHSWAEKCCDLMGLGRSGFRRVAVDANYRVVPEALRQAVLEDREAGTRPFCIIGNAGTVNTGATDDLVALADLCRELDLWFHVDGAFGALAALSPDHQHQVRGMEQADSLAFDLHKWGYLPYEVGCVLVRDVGAHRATFRTSAAYLQAPGRGIQPDTLAMPELGLQLSRGFRALKVWMSLKTHGTRRIGQVIAQNVSQAAYLVERIAEDERLELLAPAPLNVVCFRVVEPGLSEDALDAHNKECLLRVQEEGLAIPSSTQLDERFALRVAITNHRTRRQDLDLFLDGLLRISQDILSG